MNKYHFIYGKGVASEEREDWHVIASAPADFVPLYRQMAMDVINPVLATVISSIADDTQLLLCVTQGNNTFWTYSRVFHVGADASGRTLFSYHTVLMSNEWLRRMGSQPWCLLGLMAYKKGRHGFHIGGTDKEIAGPNPIQLKAIRPSAHKRPDTLNVSVDQDVVGAVQAVDIKFVDQIHRPEDAAREIFEFLTNSGSESRLGVLAGVSLNEIKRVQSKLCRFGIGLVTRLSPPVPSALAGSMSDVQKDGSSLITLAPSIGEPERRAAQSRPADNGPADYKEALRVPRDARVDFSAAETDVVVKQTHDFNASKSDPEWSPSSQGQSNFPRYQYDLAESSGSTIRNWLPWVALVFSLLAFLIVLFNKPPALTPDARIPGLQTKLRALQAEMEKRDRNMINTLHQARVAQDLSGFITRTHENERRLNNVETNVTSVGDELKVLVDDTHDTLQQLLGEFDEQLVGLQAALDMTQAEANNNLAIIEQMQAKFSTLSERLDSNASELSDLAEKINITGGKE